MKYVVSSTDPFSNADFQMYKEVSARITEVLKNLPSQEVSQEGLGSNILGKMIIGIADTFLGLLNSFKTNLFKFNKHLKRSEIKEFIESNRTKVWTVTNQIKNINQDVKLDAPAGMRVTFMTAIETLKLVYTQLNALATAKTLNSSLAEICRNVASNDSNASSSVSTAANYINVVIKGSKNAVLKCQKEFGGTRSEKINWMELYSGIEEIAKTVNELLGMESRLQDVNQLTELIRQMEGTLRCIVDTVKNASDEVKMSNRDLIVLGETAKNVALIFDSYGLAATRQLMLEHNTVLNINALYKMMTDKSKVS